MPSAERFRLSPRAREDLKSIHRFSVRRWSIHQADAYITELRDAFERIGLEPELARLRTEYRPPLRIYRHKAHVIVYTDVDYGVEILRIRHGREDWSMDPAGPAPEEGDPSPNPADPEG